jgi:hypothetical protein
MAPVWPHYNVRLGSDLIWGEFPWVHLSVFFKAIFLAVALM